MSSIFRRSNPATPELLFQPTQNFEVRNGFKAKGSMEGSPYPLFQVRCMVNYRVRDRVGLARFLLQNKVP